MMRWACAIAVCAAPAIAQDEQLFSLPAGCEAFVTVQSKDCIVEHHFICAGDPAGHKQRIALDESGMTYLGTTDAETQWIKSFHPLSGHSERLESNPVDRASLSDLIANGKDTYEFVTLSDEIGETHFKGSDILTGRTVVIDGVTLEETNYEITATDAAGEFLWSSVGQEYIHREWQTFIAGPGTTTLPGETYSEDDSPVEFIFPGEAGFLSANPKHGCGVMMSSSPVTTLKEFLNVQL